MTWERQEVLEKVSGNDDDSQMEPELEWSSKFARIIESFSLPDRHVDGQTTLMKRS